VFANEDSGPPESETGTRLIIDRSAIAANWTRLARLAAPAECGAVVKADAYGLGLVPAGRLLADAGARTFFVAHLAEARALRAALPNVAIYALNGLVADAAPAYIELGVRPVLGSMLEVAAWRGAGGGAAALHIDTGMNRLGLSPAEAADLATQHAAGTLGLAATLVMSHLACADIPNHPLNARQRSAFAAARALFPEVPASLAN